MSRASQGCGMSGSVAVVWDVARVQHKVLVGCHGASHIRGMSAHYAFLLAIARPGTPIARGVPVERKAKSSV